MLSLRSLRACSLEAVLGKFAQGRNPSEAFIFKAVGFSWPGSAEQADFLAAAWQGFPAAAGQAAF